MGIIEHTIWELLFWLSSLFILYTLIGYPCAIYLLSKLRSGEPPVADLPIPARTEWPTVAIVIPIHNEAQYLEKKLQSLRALDYPEEKLSITFVSDGSEDASNDILAAQPDIQLISYHPREGKSTALNRGVAAQSADILIFTDARQSLHFASVKSLVMSLQDPTIGAVSGELVFLDPTTETGAQLGFYWRYEKWIRAAESRYHSVAGTTGALYAIHRNDYSPLRSDALLDDFDIPITILKQGKRIIFSEEAVVYDYAQESADQENSRKIRTLTGNFQSFSRNRWLFSWRQNPIWWQFLSHKVFRLLLPYMLAMTLLSSALASGTLYSTAFIIQLLFYVAGAIDQLLLHRKSGVIANGKEQHAVQLPRIAKKGMRFAYLFIRLNFASVIALRNFLKQNINVKWQKQ